MKRVDEQVKIVVGMRDRCIYLGVNVVIFKKKIVLDKGGIMKYFILYFVHVLMRIKNCKKNTKKTWQYLY